MGREIPAREETDTTGHHHRAGDPAVPEGVVVRPRRHGEPAVGVAEGANSPWVGHLWQHPGRSAGKVGHRVEHEREVGGLVEDVAAIPVALGLVCRKAGAATM